MVYIDISQLGEFERYELQTRTNARVVRKFVWLKVGRLCAAGFDAFGKGSIGHVFSCKTNISIELTKFYKE